MEKCHCSDSDAYQSKTLQILSFFIYSLSLLHYPHSKVGSFHRLTDSLVETYKGGIERVLEDVFSTPSSFIR